MKFVLASAAVAALLAASPASAAKMMSCAGEGPSKVSTMVSKMPYDMRHAMMDQEVAKMNMAMSKGDMRGCNRAIMRAQRMSMMKEGMM